MGEKKPKKKAAGNKTKRCSGGLLPYQYGVRQENRRRQERRRGVKPKGLKNLNSTEKTYVIVIVLALIGIVIKYVIL